MPTIPGARYRVKTTTKGKKVRLAWAGDTVVEAKNLKSGATHTTAEFAEDYLAAIKRKMKKKGGK
jgi:hypothetical protein